MKRLMTKIFILMAYMITISTMIPMSNVQAATKSQGTIDLQKKMLIIPNGKKTMIKKNTLTVVKSCSYQVRATFGSTTVRSKAKWKSNKPAVVTASTTGLITAKKPGTATLRITYKGRTQTLKIKVVATHKHVWKTNKKATCEEKGKQTCTVCGTTEAIAKTKHEYKTDVWQKVEGRGKEYHVNSIYCGSCDIDMTDWTADEISKHRSNLNNLQCFSANTYGAIGEARYPKYMKVEVTDTFCKNCGIRKGEQIRKDMYEVTGWGGIPVDNTASTNDKTTPTNTP